MSKLTNSSNGCFQNKQTKHPPQTNEPKQSLTNPTPQNNKKTQTKPNPPQSPPNPKPTKKQTKTLQKTILAWSCKIESSSITRNTALTFDYSFFFVLWSASKTPKVFGEERKRNNQVFSSSESSGCSQKIWQFRHRRVWRQIFYLLLEIVWIVQKQKFSTGTQRTQLIFHYPLLLGSGATRK